MKEDLAECLDEIEERGALLVANLRNLTGDAKAADALEAIAVHLRGLFLLEASRGVLQEFTLVGSEADCHCRVCVTIKRQAQEAAVKRAEADETKPMRLPKK
jgi:hypothetical protein